YDIYVEPNQNVRTAGDFRSLEYIISKGLKPMQWSDLMEEDSIGRHYLKHLIPYFAAPQPIGYDEYNYPFYDPKCLDAYGNLIMELHHDTMHLSYQDVIGIRFVEDWYLNLSTGSLMKKVTGFSFVFNVEIDAGVD